MILIKLAQKTEKSLMNLMYLFLWRLSRTKAFEIYWPNENLQMKMKQLVRNIYQMHKRHLATHTLSDPWSFGDYLLNIDISIFSLRNNWVIAYFNVNTSIMSWFLMELLVMARSLVTYLKII